MSVHELRVDIDRAIADLPAVTLFSVDDVKKYLTETLLPLLDSTCMEMEEHDEDIGGLMDIAEGDTDMLQPETAGIFALVIKAGLEVTAELAKRLRPGNAGDEKWKKKLAQMQQICKAAEAKLFEITVEEEAPDEDAPADAVPDNDNAPADAASDDDEPEQE